MARKTEQMRMLLAILRDDLNYVRGLLDDALLDVTVLQDEREEYQLTLAYHLTDTLLRAQDSVEAARLRSINMRSRG
jgi:hypothetical protein